MINKITVTVNGKRELAVAGLTISEIIKSEKPCGGHGKCGKCKVIARGALSEPTAVELDLLSQNERDAGVRLACLTVALGNCEIETLDKKEKSQIVTGAELPEFELKPIFENYGVAIDIGTTTLAARLYDTNGNMLAEASRINPQQEWGADVISRIEAALDGKDAELACSIRGALASIISELANTAKIQTVDVDGVVITGNTVMLSLLTRESVEPFSHSPFYAKRLFGETVRATELELSCLNENTPVYLPPCVSAFVGADTTCAMIATELCSDKTAMLADIGTNGEMAIWHDGRLTVCSTAAGPAFEGVGISQGMRGATGAIDKVSIVNGALYARVLGGVEPVGICGSGLVDAVACMLDLELIDGSGYVEDDELCVSGSVTLTQKDIRMLQLAKSAICAGLGTLVDNEKLAQRDVDVLYVAGGFGNYLNKNSAARIGLLPETLANRSKTVGNAALGGACMILLSSHVRDGADALAKSAITLELSTSPIFSDKYMMGMMFEE